MTEAFVPIHPFNATVEYQWKNSGLHRGRRPYTSLFWSRDNFIATHRVSLNAVSELSFCGAGSIFSPTCSGSDSNVSVPAAGVIGAAHDGGDTFNLEKDANRRMDMKPRLQF